MTEANSVHSTPPLNTSVRPLSGLADQRRRFLLQAAGVAVGSAALGPALPLPAPAIGAAADPVFAAIERYNVLSSEYTVAVDRRAPLEQDDPDLWETEAETARTCSALFEQMDLLFSYRPTTIAGVAALLKYISTLEEWQMPPGLEDGDGKKAAQRLCTCLAAALEQSGAAA
ncbi:hypothetical protein [Bradyrhizobium japonicum]|uniref:hypothetical protein n=1 Tax=Bradyrhizobium japonicum TaxID=375 RepID=UPI001B8A2DA7|nr:hypothetical protein [Bradyrhizobium japonicum]MBR0974100.1 hypothetical protein [Bradyrhizobium japonicum]